MDEKLNHTEVHEGQSLVQVNQPVDESLVYLSEPKIKESFKKDQDDLIEDRSQNDKPSEMIQLQN